MEDNPFEDDLAPVPDQKTLILVNTFVVHTAGLLNRFSTLCERKLEAVDRSIKRVDIQLKLLESKLRSVEGIEHVRASSSAPPPSTSASTSEAAPVQTPSTEPALASLPQVAPASTPPPAPPGTEPASPPPPAAPPPITPGDEVGPRVTGETAETANEGLSTAPLVAEAAVEYVKMKDHPDYARFFRMERMGVPTQAVKNRMALEDIDSAILDNPDAPAYPT
eukprot:CAMPEP_0118948410 /NCGR_PEP_ID=MMETSP1169-20130426/47771_1 /TAXON_ID=36882 /ORGANISM="Pyramimonas obovata, Strain CCMP722" /LENGTH=221 /DNA_ID=CAMNT_0006894825 /DNA_START=226 /DNA_END=891 /DNA_ORIENTATION=-